ncbi:hypothetical protein [Staphylococcus epidermidis]|uniref:hypothetical protein n=3 Tax=Staphylococcus epidermidis TaxID=1282 RepID=UPI0021B2BEDF|nr:hypothetical protein [Staphylococcus epidermidis]
MTNNKHTNINNLFNYHFEKGNKERPNTINSIIKLKGLEEDATTQQKDLKLHYLCLKKRYSISLDYYTAEDLIQEFASLFLFVAQELEILEDLEYLLANPNIYKQRIRFIKDGISREFYTVANPNKVRVKTREGYKYIDKDVTSIDTPIGEEGDTLKDLLSDDNSLYTSKEAHHNYFIQWFLENREDILTNKQLTTFENLKDIYQPKVGNTREDNEQRKLMLDNVNLTNDSMKKIFKNIKKRTVKKYEEEFKGVYHSVNYEKYKSLDDTLLEYIESADYPGWNTATERQRELTGIIQDYYNTSEEFELIITRGLTLDEKKEVVRGVNGITLISHKVLRKINTNVKQELANKKKVDIKANYPVFDYRENVFSGLSTIQDTNLLITPAGTITTRGN